MQTGVAIERLLPDDLRGAGQGDPPEATVESGDGSFELGRRVSANRTRGSVVMKIPLRFSTCECESHQGQCGDENPAALFSFIFSKICDGSG